MMTSTLVKGRQFLATRQRMMIKLIIVLANGWNILNGVEGYFDDRPTCPRGATGLYPHPTECTKFLNCHNGRTFIQTCGPGTAYNSALSVCDWPYNVHCPRSKPNVGPEKTFNMPLLPPSSRVPTTVTATQATAAPIHETQWVGQVDTPTHENLQQPGQQKGKNKLKYDSLGNPVELVKEHEQLAVDWRHNFDDVAPSIPTATIQQVVPRNDLYYPAAPIYPDSGAQYPLYPNFKNSPPLMTQPAEPPKRYSVSSSPLLRFMQSNTWESATQGTSTSINPDNDLRLVIHPITQRPQPVYSEFIKPIQLDDINLRTGPRVDLDAEEEYDTITKKKRRMDSAEEAALSERNLESNTPASARQLDDINLRPVPRMDLDAEAVSVPITKKRRRMDSAEGEVLSENSLESDTSTLAGELFTDQTGEEEDLFLPDQLNDTVIFDYLVSSLDDKNFVIPSRSEAPETGQSIRLRGGVSHLEGYLQASEGDQWGLVCDTPLSWGVDEASVICRNLGFERGARLSWQGYHGTNSTQLDVATLAINCTARSDVSMCEVELVTESGNKCNVSSSAVAVSCYPNYVSQCQPGEVQFGGSCYGFGRPGLSLGEAAQDCKQMFGGHLLDISTQEENDFISEWLVKNYPDVSVVGSGGVGVSVFGNPLWLWEGTETPMVFQKWWRGWKGNQGIPQGRIQDPLCIALKKTYACPGERGDADSCSADYFFWEALKCAELKEMHVQHVCERPVDSIGCVTGSGGSYFGTANTTFTGEPCASWDSFNALTKISSYAHQTVSSLASKFSGHNYCRLLRPTDKAPACYSASSKQIQYCDIPPCSSE